MNNKYFTSYQHKHTYYTYLLVLRIGELPNIYEIIMELGRKYENVSMK